jgi:hypothetical protein
MIIFLDPPHLTLHASNAAWGNVAALPPNLRSLTCTYDNVFGLLARAKRCPPLVEVSAAGPEDDLVAFLGSPAALRLRRLSLGGEVNDRVARAIASSSYLGRLTTLTAYPGPVSLSAAQILAEASNLTCLTYTDLRGAEAGVDQLLLESSLRGWVGVSDPRIGSDDLAVLRHVRYRGVYWPQCLEDR